MLRNVRIVRPLFCLAACLMAALVLGLLQRVGAAQEPRYDGHRHASFYVTVRDGTKLAVDLVQPTRSGNVATERLPVVWMHTPYNRRISGGGRTVETYPGFAFRLVEHGYNVAVVDFRGLYASFGQNRANNRGEWLDAARMDAYDVTEWFARQPWSNGRIGMWGCSATGGSQMQALTTAPPSLKAIFPMSAEFDAYSFQVNGGVAPAPGAPLRALAGPAERDKAAVAVDGPDGMAQLQAAVVGHPADGDAIGDVPFRDSVSTPIGAVWWALASPHTYLEKMRKSGIGVYAVANWNEAGTKHGAFYTYRNLRNQARLLVGPAAHCGWAQVKTETGFDIVDEEKRFFDYWLKGRKNGVMNEPRVTYYTYNAPKGQEWRTAVTWPLPNEKRTTWYLGDGRLVTERPPTAGRDSVGFTKIAQAATSTTGPRETPGEHVLTYDSPVLSDDLELTGHPVMRAWISADAPDADIVARLDDVAPDGSTRSYNMHGQFRASHRALAKAPYDTMGLPWHSFTQDAARPLSEAPSEVAFEMLPLSYIFKAGHRIRLTLFFADSSSPATPGTAPRVTIVRSSTMPSSITLPVIPASGSKAARTVR
jgi:putative CocE/NonD family hydrolase